MKFPDPLLPGTLQQRYKRFLADVSLATGEEVTAHCANSGSMIGLKEPGSEVWLSPARNPDRKLKYTWELVRIGDGLVGINTQLPNHIVEEAVGASRMDELTGYSSVRREVKYGKNSRIDLLLRQDGRPDCYVEIKSVTLRRDHAAEFPDAVTARGTKHLYELSDMVKAGNRAVMVYLVQHGDCDVFSIASDIDPAYAEALVIARGAGVEAICYACHLSPREIAIGDALPLNF